MGESSGNTRMATTHIVTFLLLLAAVCIDGQAGQQEIDCSSGTACFPSRQVPSNITEEDLDFYCCPDQSWTRYHPDNDTASNCSCRPDTSLDTKIQSSTHSSLGEACLTQCQGVEDKNVCRNDDGDERCCLNNMVVRVQTKEGNFTACSCHTTGLKSCDADTLASTGDDTSAATSLAGRLALVAVLMVVWGVLGFD